MARFALRAAGVLIGLGVVAAAIVVGVAFTVLQTQTGHDFVLRMVLNQVPNHVDGEVRVESIRSDGLLRGFALGGVSIHDDRGRPFLEADALQLRYAYRELIWGRIALVPVEISGPHFVLETLHGDEYSNLARIFRLTDPEEEEEVVESEPEDDEVGILARLLRRLGGPDLADPPPVTLLLERVAIADGNFILRYPVNDDAEEGLGVLETVEGVEGLHRRLEFSDIHTLVNEAELVRPGVEGERIDFARLSMTGRVLAEPFVIEDFRGTLDRRATQLTVRIEELRLPDVEAVGVFGLDLGEGGSETSLEVRVSVAAASLDGLRWLEPRLPAGSGTFDLTVSGPLSTSAWRLGSTDLLLEGTRVQGDLGFDLGPELRLAGTDVRVTDFDFDLLDPWLSEPFPVEGRLTGRVAASGPLSALQLEGEATYDDPARELPASTARFSGGLGIGDELRVTDLSLEVDPLRYPTLQAFFPELAVTGVGTLQLEATGALSDGIQLSANVVHTPTDLAEGATDGRSSVQVAGLVRQPEGGEVAMELEGMLQPLSFAGLASGLARDLPLAGEVQGPVRLAGTLSDLVVDVDLETLAGQVIATAEVNALDLASGYRAEGRVEEFQLDRLVPAAPSPTRISGAFAVEGRGVVLEEFEGSGWLDLDGVQVAEAEVDRVGVEFRAEDGRLHLELFEVESDLVQIWGQGDLALREDVPEGAMTIEWETVSLGAFRPILLGDRVIAADTLSELEREILRFEGVDPDTLPDAVGVVLEGEARGDVRLSGSIRDLNADGSFEILNAVYADHTLASAHGRFEGGWRGDEDWEVEGVLDLGSFETGRFSFLGASAEGWYRPGEGALEVDVLRPDDESSQFGGRFFLDEEGVDVRLETLAFELRTGPWSLDSPARVRFAGTSSVEVDLLRLSRPSPGTGGGAMMQAAGRLDTEGASDIRFEVSGLDLAEIGRILQLDAPATGILDLELDVRGPPHSPEMDGHFVLTDVVTGEARLSRVEGVLDYRGLLATAEVQADLNGRRLLTASGRVPVDLSFQEVPDRFPDRTVELDVAVDSLPAAAVLALVPVLENVTGVIDGRVELRGTPRALQPAGELAIRGGGASLPEQGVRVTGVAGSVQIREDRSLDVSLEARAGGTVRVGGTVSLADLTDPGFDLQINASGFQAVDRRDLNARIGGQIALTGRYSAPQLDGSVRVEQGVIFLEEFARTAEVVDLTDPAFFDVVDTTLVASRPVVAAAENPFIRNLRMDVDLVIQRDFWLRSREMNVEMDGELTVTFDRPRRELILVGSLEAVRGVYSAFGRQFEVTEGTVEFAGTPGINPSLEIQAINRVRREGGEPLNVIASLGGTLENMTVSLSSDAQPPIAESDLISYLVFGRPSYALGSGERSVLEGAAEAGVGAGLGAIAGQLGAVVAQQFGVDYFTITQAREGAGLPSGVGVGGALAQTQIEMGQYIGQNLFLALTLRPLTGLGGRTQNQFPGARLEWRFADSWTTEAFIEDRFAREASFGFGEMGLRLDKVMGFSLYREWGY
jgi:autotransporter translocation and assembly factor TamB